MKDQISFLQSSNTAILLGPRFESCLRLQYQSLKIRNHFKILFHSAPNLPSPLTVKFFLFKICTLDASFYLLILCLSNLQFWCKFWSELCLFIVMSNPLFCHNNYFWLVFAIIIVSRVINLRSISSNEGTITWPSLNRLRWFNSCNSHKKVMLSNCSSFLTLLSHNFPPWVV